MVKRFLVLVFALVYSAMVFADFSGQTITVEYVLATEPGEDPLTVAAQLGTNPTSLTVPDNADFTFDGGVTCNIAIDATTITIGACNFPLFGNAGGVTFNGFRFTQAAAAPDIAGVAPAGPVTRVLSDADRIAVDLIGQDLQAGTAVLTVTFAQQGQPTPVPALSPLAIAAMGGLLAAFGVGRMRRRKGR